MLRSFTDLRRCTIGAKDGELGRLVDLYFDDVAWAVRYLVVDTGHWLPGRQVLISPAAVGEMETGTHVLPVALTQEQVKHSPDVDTALPVSRQRETELAAYYGWPLYWAPDASAWGTGVPTLPAGAAAAAYSPGDTALIERQAADPHLRSARDVVGYHIHARDGDIGHVADFLVQGWEWMVRYLVIDTRHFWSGKSVLIPPHDVLDVDWTEARVSVDLVREKIQDAPAYNPQVPVHRDYEERLYEYYGWKRYWE
jgi:hypothetical protein